MTLKTYTTISIYPKVAKRIITLKEDLELRNISQACQVLLTAYDIINGTGHEDKFTKAVRRAMEDNQ